MSDVLTIERAQANRAEKDGFIIDRSHGFPTSVFLHFTNSVELLADGKLVLAPPDSCILYDAATPEYFHSIGPLMHDWMHIAGPVRPAMEPFGLEPDQLYCGQKGAVISQIVRDIESELMIQGRFSRELIAADFQKLLIEIARFYSPNPGSSEQPRLGSVTQELSFRTIRSALLSDPGRDWDLSELAAMANLSVSRFSAIYKDLFRVSPIDDLIAARVETAKKCLVNTHLSVQALSGNLGYKNNSHFCRQFKKLTGMTPSEYRKAHAPEALPEAKT